MKKVAEVFKEKTGKDYQTAVVWKMTTKKKLTKTVYTYYNWIIGYGVNADHIPEIVFIPVRPQMGVDWRSDLLSKNQLRNGAGQKNHPVCLKE